LIYDRALAWLISPRLIVIDGEVVTECSVFDYHEFGIWLDVLLLD